MKDSILIRLLRPAGLLVPLLLVGPAVEAKAASSARFPFPRMATIPYAHGMAKASGTSSNAIEVQRNYQEWLDTFYVEGTCGTAPCARIRYDDRTYTVSEGIGYGMLILVYMDNAQNDTRAKFDRLWAYYNAFLDKKGLMNWKVQGFEKVNGSGAATDAELDVALVLITVAWTPIIGKMDTIDVQRGHTRDS